MQGDYVRYKARILRTTAFKALLFSVDMDLELLHGMDQSMVTPDSMPFAVIMPETIEFPLDMTARAPHIEGIEGNLVEDIIVEIESTVFTKIIAYVNTRFSTELYDDAITVSGKTVLLSLAAIETNVDLAFTGTPAVIIRAGTSVYVPCVLNSMFYTVIDATMVIDNPLYIKSNVVEDFLVDVSATLTGRRDMKLKDYDSEFIIYLTNTLAYMNRLEI